MKKPQYSTISSNSLVVVCALCAFTMLYSVAGKADSNTPDICKSDAVAGISDAMLAQFANGSMPAPCAATADGVAPDAWSGANSHAAAIKACATAMQALIDKRFCGYAALMSAFIEQGSKIHDALCNAAKAEQEAAKAGDGQIGATSKLTGLAAGGMTGSKQTLDLLLGGLDGVQSAISSDLLNNATVAAILDQMRTDRAGWGAIIGKRLAATGAAPSGDATPYRNMFEAANDLYAYDRAGSWTVALSSLKTNSGAQAQSAKTQRSAALGGSTMGQSAAPSQPADCQAAQ